MNDEIKKFLKNSIHYKIQYISIEIEAEVFSKVIFTSLYIIFLILFSIYNITETFITKYVIIISITLK
jgi:hypothetical protein